MNNDQRAHTLRELTALLTERRLLTPARILLDVMEPLGFIASQVALFARPLIPHSRWRSYVAALDDQHGWHMLHDMVDRHDERNGE